MNAFKNHTNVSTSSLSAPLVIRNLIAELTAGDQIIRTLHRYMPMHQLVHAKLDLKERGVVDQNLQRIDERAAVIALATSFAADLTAPPAPSSTLANHTPPCADEFMRGVIAALGALAPHSAHGDVMHDEIVKSVGKDALYRIAEVEDVEWAGLDPVHYAAVHAKNQVTA
ncbi:hypothetical protein [Pseudoduganella sp. RAF53_2]|uniref:hypothetical protein n=1 Tax=unclassified Pseudoduganella TaxID=2637179 RepID=UPI003F9C937C